MNPSCRPIVLLALLALPVGGCGLFGGGHKTVTAVSDPGYIDPSGPGGTGLSPNSNNKDTEAGATLAVNAYLWRGALETLGFMPLASADPYGGVIVTDWYSPPTTQDERFKATAFVLGRQLRADGVRISIFRQVRQGGAWVDAPVNPATAVDIENKVLARARELRAASASAQK
jgi:hypothetical protein